MGARRAITWRMTAWLVVAAAYFGSAKLGLSFAIAPYRVSAFWPPAGIALAAVLLGGYGLLPAVTLGALAAGLSADSPAGAVIAASVGSTLEAALAVALLRRADFRPTLDRIRDVVALVALAAVISSALGALIGIVSLFASGALHASQMLSAWRVWWLGDMGGDLLVASAVLVLAYGDFSVLRSRRGVGAIALIIFLSVASAFLLRDAHGFAYLVFAMPLVLALLYRQAGAIAGGLVAAGLVAWFTSHGHSPFAGGSSDAELMRAQTFVTIGSILALLIAAAASERHRARVALSRFTGIGRSAISQTSVDRLAGEHFRTLFETAPYARVILDEHGAIVLVNAHAEKLFGQDRMRLLGRQIEELVPTPARAPNPWYRDVGPTGRPGSVELRALREDGSDFPVEISLAALPTDHEVLISVALKDVTEQKLAADLLAHQANHDHLTGLPNRTLFLDRLEHALARARRSGRQLAVVFLDLDDFKVVNDTCGHDTGDLLLVALTPRLTGALRPGDTIARFGGDEFVVLCEDLAAEWDAVRIAERIVEACREPTTIGGQEHVVTVSAGVSVVESGAATASEVLSDADAAMYRAKARGSGCVEVLDALSRERRAQRGAVETELREALERGELRLLYQPVMEIPGGEIVGIEALLRWQHPVRGLLEPAEFVHLAESSGLIVAIGEWVITTVCRQALRWRDLDPAGHGIPVSINLSTAQITHSDLAATVAAALGETGVDPSLLAFEVTESMLLAEGEATARALRRLTELGVRLVLDDFGAGYASLRSLNHFAIDALKIDRSFIGALGQNSDNTPIVEAVLNMAHALHVTAIAKGIETSSQLACLLDQGCTQAQGYLLSRPLTAEEMKRVLTASETDTGIGAAEAVA